VPYTDDERRRTPGCSATPEAAPGERDQTRAERIAAEFVLKLLKKRLFSSPAALRITLAQARRTLAGAARPAAQQPSGADPAFCARDRRRTTRSTPTTRPSRSRRREAVDGERDCFRPAQRRGARLLGRCSRGPSRLGAPDSKARRSSLAERDGAPRAAAGPTTRVILFTEYRATQNWLQDPARRRGPHPGRARLDPLRRHGHRASARRSRPRSRPAREVERCASCWRPTRPPRASTSRTTAHRSSTTRSPGTPTDGAAQRPHRPPRPARERGPHLPLRRPGLDRRRRNTWRPPATWRATSSS
jgi:hypothetical protein